MSFEQSFPLMPVVRTKSGYFCAAAWETCVEIGKDDTNIVRNTEFVSSTVLGSLMCREEEEGR